MRQPALRWIFIVTFKMNWKRGECRCDGDYGRFIIVLILSKYLLQAIETNNAKSAFLHPRTRSIVCVTNFERVNNVPIAHCIMGFFTCFNDFWKEFNRYDGKILWCPSLLS